MVKTTGRASDRGFGSGTAEELHRRGLAATVKGQPREGRGTSQPREGRTRRRRIFTQLVCRGSNLSLGSLSSWPWKDIITTILAIFGTILSAYNFVTNRRDSKAQKLAQRERRENPIRLALFLERTYESRTVRYHEIERIKDTYLVLRVINVSGEAISINEPYLLAADNSTTTLDVVENFPLRMEAGSPFVCRVLLTEVLQDYADMEQVDLRPICEVLTVGEFEGRVRTFRNRLYGSARAPKRTSRPKQAPPRQIRG